MNDLRYLPQLPFWEKLTDSEKELIRSHTSIHQYPKGQLIHISSTDCMGMTMLLEGELRASVLSEEGREITLYRLHKNELCIMTASCLLNQITFDTQMTASADCTVLVISTFAFEKLIEQNIYARCFMYELLSERFSSVMWTMQTILFQGFDRRLASFLYDEYERTGAATINLTHDQIAAYTSSAREVVARMLKRFAADGLLEYQRGVITLKNLQALKAML